MNVAVELYIKYNGALLDDCMDLTVDETTKFNEGVPSDDLFELTQGKELW